MLVFITFIWIIGFSYTLGKLKAKSVFESNINWNKSHIYMCIGLLVLWPYALGVISED